MIIMGFYFLMQILRILVGRSHSKKKRRPGYGRLFSNLPKNSKNSIYDNETSPDSYNRPTFNPVLTPSIGVGAGVSGGIKVSFH